MQPCYVQVVASRDQVITFYHADLGGGGLAHEKYLRGSCTEFLESDWCITRNRSDRLKRVTSFSFCTTRSISGTENLEQSSAYNVGVMVESSRIPAKGSGDCEWVHEYSRPAALANSPMLLIIHAVACCATCSID